LGFRITLEHLRHSGLTIKTKALHQGTVAIELVEIEFVAGDLIALNHGHLACN
jgi:hypothetical protein